MRTTVQDEPDPARSQTREAPHGCAHADAPLGRVSRRAAGGDRAGSALDVPRGLDAGLRLANALLAIGLRARRPHRRAGGQHARVGRPVLRRRRRQPRPGAALPPQPPRVARAHAGPHRLPRRRRGRGARRRARRDRGRRPERSNTSSPATPGTSGGSPASPTPTPTSRSPRTTGSSSATPVGRPARRRESATPTRRGSTPGATGSTRSPRSRSATSASTPARSPTAPGTSSPRSGCRVASTCCSPVRAGRGARHDGVRAGRLRLPRADDAQRPRSPRVGASRDWSALKVLQIGGAPIADDTARLATTCSATASTRDTGRPRRCRSR